MVDVVPLLVTQLVGVVLGEALVQDVLDRQENGGAGPLALLPVEDQLLGVNVVGRSPASCLTWHSSGNT